MHPEEVCIPNPLKLFKGGRNRCQLEPNSNKIASFKILVKIIDKIIIENQSITKAQ